MPRLPFSADALGSGQETVGTTPTPPEPVEPRSGDRERRVADVFCRNEQRGVSRRSGRSGTIRCHRPSRDRIAAASAAAGCSGSTTAIWTLRAGIFDDASRNVFSITAGFTCCPDRGVPANTGHVGPCPAASWAWHRKAMGHMTPPRNCRLSAVMRPSRVSPGFRVWRLGVTNCRRGIGGWRTRGSTGRRLPAAWPGRSGKPSSFFHEKWRGRLQAPALWPHSGLSRWGDSRRWHS